MSRKIVYRYAVLLLMGVAILSTYFALRSGYHNTVSLIRDGLKNKIYLQNILEENVVRKSKNVLNNEEPTSRISFQRFSSVGLQSDHISIEDFHGNPNKKTGNAIIDNYSESASVFTLNDAGEYGRPVSSDGVNETLLKEYERMYQINVLLSDKIPLNRHVPDSRTKGCSKLRYEHDLPTASIIIPFYDEWYSILLRTVYSIVIRTPRHLLQEIIIIDDNSSMVELKDKLDAEIRSSFPIGLVKIIRNRKRMGLIKCRLEGWKHATGDVLVFFDSHMEVNIDWLQPLLTEIKKDRKTIAMSVLDYIDRLTFKYTFYEGYFNRYGFDWQLTFFETFFRPEQIGRNITNARVGTTMVGAAYAVDKTYFEEVGSYDEGMDVWGGENLEMSWRVWLCGGRLIHLPCSHIGHIARGQPYSFPGGRRQIEVRNYKRAVDVWMDKPMRKFVYDYFPEMKHIDVGDLSNRKALKERLQCKNFTYFIDNVWPELTVFDRNAIAWGSVVNNKTGDCLDTHNYLFSEAEPLYAYPCHYHYAVQGFSLTRDNLLRSSLQCVILKANEQTVGSIPYLKSCLLTKQYWEHSKEGQIRHVSSGLCLSIDTNHTPIMTKCQKGLIEQKWKFTHYE